MENKKIVNYDKIIINGQEYAKGIIYMFKNKINNKCYIGQTINEKGRYISHIRGKKYGNRRLSIIDSAIQKYGIDNFEYSVLFTSIHLQPDIVKEQLNEWEKKLIEMYNTISPNGYNIKPGGACIDTSKYRMSLRGHIVSEETKRKISETHKNMKLSEEHIANIRKAAEKRKGTKLSEEHKQKIKNSLLANPRIGYTHSNEIRKKISEALKGKVFNFSAETIQKRKEFLIQLNKDPNHIEKVKNSLKGKAFTEQHQRNVNKKLMNQIQFYKNGKHIKTYNSLKECIEDLKNEISKASICRILHGKYVEKYSEYEFKYEGIYHKREKLIDQYDENMIFIKQ